MKEERCKICGKANMIPNTSTHFTCEECGLPNPPPENGIEPKKDHGQGVISIIGMPTTQDRLAVGRAVSELLREGWIWCGLDVSQGNETIMILRREWRV